MIGGKTLVHCIMGISRSVSICVAYLMRYSGIFGRCNKMGADEAVRYVKERRKYAGPNRGFMAQLLEYEKYLDGGKSLHEYDKSGSSMSHHELSMASSDAKRNAQEAALRSIETITDLLKLELLKPTYSSLLNYFLNLLKSKTI